MTQTLNFALGLVHACFSCLWTSSSYKVQLRAWAAGRSAALPGLGILNKCMQNGTCSSRVAGQAPLHAIHLVDLFKWWAYIFLSMKGLTVAPSL